MPKSKTKTLPESKLLKAMAELEETVAKGDVLASRDPEGGLSTEGAPLSNAAPSGKASRTKKSAAKSSSSSSDDASSVEKADDEDESSMAKMLSCSGGDDESSEGSPPPFKKKSKSKDKKVAKAESMSDDDSSGDDESSGEADAPAEKSLRDLVKQDEVMSKAIQVSDFLESFVDRIGVCLQQMTKSFKRELTAAEARINTRIDHRVAKSASFQHDFNTRMAKAISSIGNSVQNDLVDVVKSLVNSPVSTPRGKALLSKSEVNQPPWGGQGDDRMATGSDSDFTTELQELSVEAINDWMFKKSVTNTIDPKLILAFEANQYNVETLPLQIRKALVQDLCK